MIEDTIIIDDIDPVVFYGTNSDNLQFIKTLFPKLQIIARGSVIKVIGEEQDIKEFINKVEQIKDYCKEFNALDGKVIGSIVNSQSPKQLNNEKLIIHGISGKQIVTRTENQYKLLKAFEKNDLIFAIGPAGTGKTYVAIALAVKSLKNREVRKIILSRPAVEAGEKLGFLPGDMKDKIDPYLQPLYDALQDMIPAVKLKDMMENNIIQIAPLAFMRGRTLNDAVVILDEAQNTTMLQTKMFLTRMGANAKMIITGDMSQVDLPSSQKSGLSVATHILKDIKGVSIINFDKKDIVRHRLVQDIVDAYDKQFKGSSKTDSTNKHKD